MNQAVSSIMQRNVTPARMDDTVEEVETLMKARGVSSAPVCKGNTLLGIITASDLIDFHAKGKDPRSVHAWEICHYRPFEVRPDTPVSEVAELMLAHDIHHVVVTQDDSVQGIVSSLDFVRLFAEQGKR